MNSGNIVKQDIEILPKICDEYIQHFEQWVQSKENSFILHSNKASDIEKDMHNYAIIEKLEKLFIEFKNYKKSFSVLLDAPWGSGKTKLIEEWLKNRNKIEAYNIKLDCYNSTHKEEFLGDIIYKIKQQLHFRNLVKRFLSFDKTLFYDTILQVVVPLKFLFLLVPSFLIALSYKGNFSTWLLNLIYSTIVYITGKLVFTLKRSKPLELVEEIKIYTKDKPIILILDEIDVIPESSFAEFFSNLRTILNIPKIFYIILWDSKIMSARFKAQLYPNQGLDEAYIHFLQKNIDEIFSLSQEGILNSFLSHYISYAKYSPSEIQLFNKYMTAFICQVFDKIEIKDRFYLTPYYKNSWRIQKAILKDTVKDIFNIYQNKIPIENIAKNKEELLEIVHYKVCLNPYSNDKYQFENKVQYINNLKYFICHNMDLFIPYTNNRKNTYSNIENTLKLIYEIYQFDSIEYENELLEANENEEIFGEIVEVELDTLSLYSMWLSIKTVVSRLKQYSLASILLISDYWNSCISILPEVWSEFFQERLKNYKEEDIIEEIFFLEGKTNIEKYIQYRTQQFRIDPYEERYIYKVEDFIRGIISCSFTLLTICFFLDSYNKFFTKKPFETKVYSIEYEGTIHEISPNWDHTPVINTILKDWTIDKFEFERKHLLENYPLFIQDKILEDISPTLIWIKNYLKK